MNIALIENNRSKLVKEYDLLMDRYPGCTVFCYSDVEQALGKLGDDKIEMLLLKRDSTDSDKGEISDYLEEQNYFLKVEWFEKIIETV
ncbi:MAG: hypothetical protein E7254_04485 [Lachnospiraceae bacterium]|nr:hypothetical protein [Lachnospiraceae bacterium]